MIRKDRRRHSAAARRGPTWHRFATLADWASVDLSLGRLCEGHSDALAILAEAGRHAVEGASYGVWASRSGAATTFAERSGDGWVLSGAKEFCSGSGSIDRALVTAVTGEGYLLFDINVPDQVVSQVEGSWPAVGMARSESRTLHFGGPIIPDDAVVGGAEFYLERAGFWFGAVGVAACWFGGAVGLVNGLIDWINPEPDDLQLADLGAIFSELETMRYTLKSVARAIDDDPSDLAGQAQVRALAARASFTMAPCEFCRASRPWVAHGPYVTTPPSRDGPRTCSSISLNITETPMRERLDESSPSPSHGADCTY